MRINLFHHLLIQFSYQHQAMSTGEGANGEVEFSTKY